MIFHIYPSIQQAMMEMKSMPFAAKNKNNTYINSFTITKAMVETGKLRDS